MRLTTFGRLKDYAHANSFYLLVLAASLAVLVQTSLLSDGYLYLLTTSQ